MPHNQWAECPKCGKLACTREEIEEYFGFRFDGEKPQSWCRACRARERREKNCQNFACQWHGTQDCSQHYNCVYEDD